MIGRLRKTYIQYNINYEVWLSLVERCVRDAEAAGSSPVTSTMLNVHNGLNRYEHSFLCTLCCSFFIILNSRLKLVIKHSHHIF